MGKTAAEIQKAYRERKKLEEGERYMKRERERVRKYYIPTSQLNNQARTDRQRKVRHQVRNHRLTLNTARSTSAKTESKAVDDPRVERDDAVPSTSDLPTKPLIVQLPFNKGRKKNRRRISRCVAKAHREISYLKDQNVSLMRRIKRISKRHERLLHRIQKKKTGGGAVTDQLAISPSKGPNSKDLMTPRSRTNLELKEMNGTPKTMQKVRRRLMLTNCLQHEIVSVKQTTNRHNLKSLVNVISGQVVKKYRCISRISNHIGINRRTLLRARSKNVNDVTRHRSQAMLHLHQQVTEYFERDDNSRLLPGKADAVKHGNVKKQKRVLNDYLANIFLKFRSEYPEFKISLATFCRLRPSHVMLVSFTSRNTCLCSKHQNIALKLKTLKTLNVTTTTSPDSFIKTTTQEDLKVLLLKIDRERFSFKTWKKISYENGKQKTKLVEEETTKEDFSVMFQNQIAEFCEHVLRVQTQYAQLRHLKENLPDSHVIVQMDFAENYLCQSRDEVQSAYWNSTMVTLHPTVVYYKSNDGLAHRSFIFVSDTMCHSFGTVYTILQSLLPEIKELVPGVTHVHYWTDSPSSQYRNKNAFRFVCSHEDEFGVKASWHYFEAGHGKGPCDGLGGTAKRMADSAVRQGKCSIQDATDFIIWATGQSSSVSYIFVEKGECERNRKKLESLGVKPVKGTMAIHSVYGLNTNSVMTRETSCFCNGCFAGETGFLASPSCSWDTKTISMKPPDFEKDQETSDISVATEAEVESELQGDEVTSGDVHWPPVNSLQHLPTVGPMYDVDTDDFVAAVYQFDNKFYFGQVLETDERYAVISFMASFGKTGIKYCWPKDKKSETILVSKHLILCKINNPERTRKSKRIFTFLSTDVDRVKRLYREYLDRYSMES